MSHRFALPEAADVDDLTAEDVAALMPLLAQIQQARSDQQEALAWLAQHAADRPQYS
jgi:hypothetical protein